MAKTNSRKYLGIGFLVGLLIGLALFFGLYFGLPANCSDNTGRVLEGPNYMEYDNSAVAADAGECSKIGQDMLDKGGHAVDAAIAGMLCAGLFNFHSAGIGGGFFMTVYDAETDNVTFINSREVAPLAATQDMYNGSSDLSQTGSLAIAVVGEVSGYWEAHQRFGKLQWSELFEPSIKLAAEGVPVSKAFEYAIALNEEYIRNESILTHPNGSLKVEGDYVVHSDLAYTLRRIAKGGAEEFYHGALAQDVVNDIKDGFGTSIITLEDMERFKPEVRESLAIDLDGKYTVYSPPPTGSGAVLLYILNILEGYGLTPKDLTANEVLTDHRIIEAFKFAYAKRTELGDDRYNEEIKLLVDNMTSESYAEDTRLKITDDQTQDISYYGAEWAEPPDDSGTSHISVLAEDGSAASLTSTINLRFGSKVRGFRTGIMFNNEMDDFSSPNIVNAFGVPPSPNNYIEPEKRPLSSMTPTILLTNDEADPKKKVKMISGASGGTKITTGTALSIMNLLWFDMGLKESVASLRLHHQLAPEYIHYEEGYDMTVIGGLMGKGHEAESFTPPGSVVQAISRLSNGKIAAVSDHRKGGFPDGS